MATTDNKYIVKDFIEGLYEFNTVYIEKDKIEYQIPISKEKVVKIGDEIVIKNLFTPIV